MIAPVALLAPLFIALSEPSNFTSPKPDAALRKCRNAVQKNPAIFLDGRISSEAELKELTGDPTRQNALLAMVEVTCLNPADSTHMDLKAMTLGLPAIVVWTTKGPYQHIKPTLEAVRDAQKAYFAKNKKYSRDIAALQLAPLAPEIKLTVNTTPTGWTAIASIDRKLSPICTMTESEMPQTKPKGDEEGFSCR